MSGWSDRDLALIGAAEEIVVAPDRTHDIRGPAVPIWVVCVGDELYVRSFRGTSGGWYRRARGRGEGWIRAAGEEFRVRFRPVAASELRAPIDEAYRIKYGRYGPSYVTPMTSDSAAGTTLQLEPAAEPEPVTM
jgi:hypothetical protein